MWCNLSTTKMRYNSRMKVIVTGGAGFIGSNLVDALVARGDDVHVIDNLATGKRENVNEKATLHEVDICDFAAIRPIFDKAEVVFHVAALPRVQPSIDNPIPYNKTNIDGTLNVLVAARDAGVTRVVSSASGGSVYGDQKEMPFVETMKPKPLSPYGLQKYVVEHYTRLFAMLYGMKTCSLRYFNVYGPRMIVGGSAYDLVIGRFLDLRKKGEPLTIVGDGKQTRDFTHVNDVVRANILASESEKAIHGESINIGGGERISILELAEIIGGPTTKIPARVEVRDTLADISLARELIGWEPQIDFATGLSDLKKDWGID